MCVGRVTTSSALTCSRTLQQPPLTTNSHLHLLPPPLLPHRHHHHKHQQAQDLLRNLFLAAFLLYWLMGFISMAARLSPAATKTLWGSTSVAVLGVYYVAPLTSVAKVVAERDSSSLHWPLCSMNIINGMLWFAYGLALKDWFISLPVSHWCLCAGCVGGWLGGCLLVAARVEVGGSSCAGGHVVG